MKMAEQRKAEIITDGVILALFRQGMDTLAIARQLGCHEADVYNRLNRAREVGH